MCCNYKLYFVIKIIEILVWSLREFKKDNDEIKKNIISYSNFIDVVLFFILIFEKEKKNN